MLHRVGLVGRINGPSDTFVPDIQAPSVNLDFNSSLPVGWTYTRASTATDSTYLDRPDRTTFASFANDVPRFLTFGLLQEPTRTNLFLNSAAPATQNVTVIVGTYFLWMVGTGSVTSAAGTAVGTGFDVASSGNYVTMVITTGGTVSLTVAGSVLRAQFELANNASGPTSYIVSAGTPATRAVNSLSGPVAGLNLSEGTYLVEFFNAGSDITSRIMTAGQGSFTSNNNSDAIYNSGSASPGPVRSQSFQGATALPVSITNENNPFMAVVRVAAAMSTSRNRLAMNGLLAPDANPDGRPSLPLTIVTLGRGGTNTVGANQYLRKFRYWPVALDDQSLVAITRPGYFRDGPVFTLDFTSGVMPREATFTRAASSGVVTDGKYTDAPGSAYNTFATGVPRFTGGGLLLEANKNNYIGNSNAPVTGTSLGITAGNAYMAWIIGTGSMTLANDTGTLGTIVGPNPVVAGTPTYFTMATAGNLNVTMTGSVNRAQIEQSTLNATPFTPTTFIQTVGAGQFRGQEWVTFPRLNWHNPKQHTMYAEFVPTSYMSTFQMIMSLAVNNGTDRETLSFSNADVSTPAMNLVYGVTLAIGGSGNAITTTTPNVTPNVTHKAACIFNESDRLIVLDGIVSGSVRPRGGIQTIDKFFIGTFNTTGSNPSNMIIKNARYYDYALSTQEMIDLTTTLDLNFMIPGTLDPAITFTRASTATYFDSAGVMQTAAVNAPRWDYNPSTLALNGLLIEEQRANLLLNSATLSTQSVTTTAAAHTLSFYGTGTITRSGTSTGALVGTGANQRVSVTFTPTAGSLTCTVTGTVTNAQIELGAFPTSYIPTTSAAVTRAFDIANMPTTGWFDQTKGSIAATFINAAWNAGGTRNNGVWTLDDGAGNRQNAIDMMAFANAATFIQPNLSVRTANVAVGSIAYSNINLGGAAQAKIAASWVSTPLALSANGLAAQTASLTGALPAISRLNIGFGFAGLLPLGGYMRQMQYWPRVLTASELQAITK